MGLLVWEECDMMLLDDISELIFIQVSGGLICYYVWVFGDYNFIYFSQVIVKLFGFKCVIVYGMWMVVWVIFDLQVFC